MLLSLVTGQWAGRAVLACKSWMPCCGASQAHFLNSNTTNVKLNGMWRIVTMAPLSLPPVTDQRGAGLPLGNGRTVEPGSLLSGATRRPPEPAILGSGCSPHSARRCKAACARGLDRRSAPCLPINRSPAGEISVFKRRIFGAPQRTKMGTQIIGKFHSNFLKVDVIFG